MTLHAKEQVLTEQHLLLFPPKNKNLFLFNLRCFPSCITPQKYSIWLFTLGVLHGSLTA